MSLSELLTKYPADLRIIQAIKARGMERADLQRAPRIVVLADAFVREGAGGLKELMERIAGSGLAIRPDLFEDLFRSLPPEHRDPLLENYAAIAFGLSVMSLHEMLVNGFFDARDWSSRYNIAITGLRFPKLAVIKGNPIEEMSEEKLKILRQRASEEKALSFFFNEPYLMPDMLRGHLERFGVLPLIRSSILPLYKERAQFLG